MRSFAGRAAALLALTGLSACAQVTTGAETVAQLPRMAVQGTVDFFEFVFTRPELAIEAIEIGRLPSCNSTGRESVLELFTDPAAVKAWETARGIKLTPVTGELPPGIYAVAEMGERNTGGYSLAVSRKAAMKDDALYIKASFLVPSNAGMVTQAVTSPCSLVLVPTRLYGRAYLLDQTNKVRASWSASGVGR